MIVTTPPVIVTTPTTVGTTVTTAPTTVPAVTTAPPTTLPTTAPPTTAATPVTDELPRTGAGDLAGPLALFGFGLVLAGTGLVLPSRRRTA